MTAIVPAAGSASRFGRPKLVELVKGMPLIARTVTSLLDGGLWSVIVVASSATATQFDGISVFDDPRVRIAMNTDPARGMFSSVLVGLELLSCESGVVVLPADMPFVRSATIKAIVAEAARHDSVVVPSHDGRRGHPVVIPGRCRFALRAADPRSTLKDALRTASVDLVTLDVDDPGVLRDVDRPTDLEFR